MSCAFSENMVRQTPETERSGFYLGELDQSTYGVGLFRYTFFFFLPVCSYDLSLINRGTYRRAVPSVLGALVNHRFLDIEYPHRFSRPLCSARKVHRVDIVVFTVFCDLNSSLTLIPV